MAELHAAQDRAQGPDFIEVFWCIKNPVVYPANELAGGALQNIVIQLKIWIKPFLFCKHSGFGGAERSAFSIPTLHFCHCHLATVQCSQ